MELTVKTNEFAPVLRLVQAVTERKTTIPVLGTVLLAADLEGLTVTGTDLELGAMCRCPATIRKPGTLAVPAQRLSEYVKMLPAGDLHLKEQSSSWLALSFGRSKSRIAGTPANIFPELPKPPESGVTVPCGVLARLAEKVVCSISTEQNPVTLGGALLKLDGSGLTMVATDGHRRHWLRASPSFPIWNAPSKF
jgi:DNA polymerase-3 subunit beta